MARTFSLAHLTADLCSPQQLVEIAAEAGYDHVSFRMTPVTESEKVHPLIHNRKLMDETLERLDGKGLDVLDVELVRMDSESRPEQYGAFLDAAAQLGARSVICQLPDPDQQRAAEKFAELCDLALPYNLGIALEFVSWTDTPNLGAARHIITAADRANGGLLIDTLHFDRSASSLDDLEKVPRSWFQFVHLCDAAAAAPVSRNASIYTARHNRLFPGDGDIKLAEILSRVPPVPYSLEIPNSAMTKKYGLATFCRLALEKTKQYLSSQQLNYPHSTGNRGSTEIAAI